MFKLVYGLFKLRDIFNYFWVVFWSMKDNYDIFRIEEKFEIYLN